MIIDAHANLGRSLYGPQQTIGDLLARMDTHGIDRAVVSPFTAVDLDFRHGNHEIAKTVAANQRLLGFARIDPRFGSASIAELGACQREGLCGVKVDPFEQAFHINSALVREFFVACAAAGMPILVVAGHPNVSSPIQIGDLAEQVPTLDILMAHGGQLAMHGLGILDCLSVVNDVPNVYVESSGIPETGTESLIEHIVCDVSPTRVVFGTNTPINHPEMEIERVVVANIADSAKEQIFGANIARILGLSAEG